MDLTWNDKYENFFNILVNIKSKIKNEVGLATEELNFLETFDYFLPIFNKHFKKKNDIRSDIIPENTNSNIHDSYKSNDQENLYKLNDQENLYKLNDQENLYKSNDQETYNKKKEDDDKLVENITTEYLKSLEDRISKKWILYKPIEEIIEIK